MPLFGLQTEGLLSGKRVKKIRQDGGIDFFAEFNSSPYEKKFIRTNELLFITRLIGSFQAFSSPLFGKEIN